MKNVVKKQHGFTLLELVVVVAVLGLIASLATEFVTLETNQQRFDTTKTRINQIRYAVVGDDSRSMNGQPTLSGYVTDMGELPTELRQLMMASYCSDARFFSSADCTSNGGTWETQSGWKGPYLQPTGMEMITDGTGNSRQITVFRDAWGNRNTDDNEDWKNFGWDFNRVDLIGSNWTDTATGLSLKVQSLGLDGASGTVSASSSKEVLFEAEYPVLNETTFPLVTENDYLAGKKAVTVSVKNETPSAVELCLVWNGVEDGQRDYLNTDALLAASTATPSFDATMGYVGFSVKVDDDGDDVCEKNYEGELEFNPASTIAVHDSVPSNLVITLKP